MGYIVTNAVGAVCEVSEGEGFIEFALMVHPDKNIAIPCRIDENKLLGNYSALFESSIIDASVLVAGATLEVNGHSVFDCGYVCVQSIPVVFPKPADRGLERTKVFGRVANVELAKTQGDLQVANFVVFIDDITSVTCQAWRNVAQAVGDRLYDGALVLAEGRSIFHQDRDPYLDVKTFLVFDG